MTVSVTAEADGDADGSVSPEESPPQQPQQQTANITQQARQQPAATAPLQPQAGPAAAAVAPPPTPPPLTDEELLAAFPIAKLNKLDELISNPRWVIPVLPGGELEVLLDHAIELCSRGIDTQSEPCQRFFRDGLNISFTKIMTDEAVSSWRFDIHKCILKNCEKLVQLICTKLQDDWFPLLELLAMIFNPSNKFHVYNSSRVSESSQTGLAEDATEPFAQSIDSRGPKGWLVDLLNTFGKYQGFEKLHKRIISGENLTIPLIYSLVRPFGLCYELLTVRTARTYFLPIVEAVPHFLENLTDEELKKESKNENKYDTISAIVKSLKHLCSLVPGREENVRSLEMFRLKMLLRQLQISSFSGKMSALNEVNKVIAGVAYTPNRYNSQVLDDEDWLTAEKMVGWIKENNLIKIVLRDSLHQPQYVEKLEKILRFVIKEKALTSADLDDIWAAQAGKHEAIVKNIHELLAKLAWDFSAEQLDHLFECFQASWKGAASKQREKLLELIRRLAEDDKDGVMAEKVLKLFWSLAHSQDVTVEIMDQALAAHVKILDYSCTQYRDQQKNRWLDQCVEELKTNDQWVLPALKQIKDICCLYQEQQASGTQRTPGPAAMFRHEVINRLQQSHALVILIAENLTEYMARIRHSLSPAALAQLDPNEYAPDGRYSHTAQLAERLNFLRFLLRDGQLWLCAPQAKQIWHCLAENAIFPSDREQCFKWFSKLMGDEPDLDPEINREFFESNLLQLDPVLLTEAGIKCFERFFKAVNVKEGKLLAKRREHLLEDMELVGLEYCWQVILKSSDEVATKAIQLLKEILTNLGPRLQAQQTAIHEDFIAHCMDILRSSYDTVSMLKQGGKDDAKLADLTQRLCRTLHMLYEYISECDNDYQEERTLIPLYRAARGRQVHITVRCPNTGRQLEDIELLFHDHDTLAALRRAVYSRLKASTTSLRLELVMGGEVLEPVEDRKILARLGFRDKVLITAKLIQVNSGGGGGGVGGSTGGGAGGASSPDSSSDSSAPSPQHSLYDGPNVEAERCLPGVIMAAQGNHTPFLCSLADLGSQLGLPALRDAARDLLRLLPAEQAVVTALRSRIAASAAADEGASGDASAQLERLFQTGSESVNLYNLEVCLALLLPATSQQNINEAAHSLQVGMMKAGGVGIVLRLLVNPVLLQLTDPTTQQQTYLVVVRLARFLLLVAAHSLLYMVVEAQQAGSTIKVSDATHNHAVVLQQAIQACVPCPGEVQIRQIALRLGQILLGQGACQLPEMAAVRHAFRLAWAATAGDLALQTAAVTAPDRLRAGVLQQATILPGELGPLAREALEVLTLAVALHPPALDTLTKDKTWQAFVIDSVLLCRDRSVRQAAADQFLMMATLTTPSHTQSIKFMLQLLFTVNVGSNLVTEQQAQAAEYFQLVARLLACLAASGATPLTNLPVLLDQEVALLARARASMASHGHPGLSDTLLEGHLALTRELVMFLTPDKKQELGSSLVRELVEDWIFPASKLWVTYAATGQIPDVSGGGVITEAVCQSPATTTAAFDLLVALCTNCPANLALLARMLADMFYGGRTENLTEWEYLPPVGPRPAGGFVGLKNAGATCYMNSVLQQLFMLEGIRQGVLSADGTCTDPGEDFSGDERSAEDASAVLTAGSELVEPEGSGDGGGNNAKSDYNVTILKQVQAIFGHLSETQLQYYIPKGLWKHFRMLGEPVNLREQQDAVEFFMTLIDTIDEALKSLGHPQVCSQVLGGIISDQKICKTCPHRYSRQEPCSVISVDVKNHSNLQDSLAEYTKGELLETENAYFCEQCSKKVDTVKRLCVKKLPPILVIQLKRFDYDFEREQAIKFNDYFEFPRELDMEPYTVAGLARRENEAVDCGPEDLDPGIVRKYVLRGMVVHSGQASGGHYFSYIRQGGKWFKFDDGDVTEVNIADDEELKNQCWGGEYMSEVFDHMLKRMSYRRQKRWWNAYMLFYCRADLDTPLDTLTAGVQELSLKKCKMPAPIEKSIIKQNVKFLHNRNQFSLEYFNFMKKLIGCNAGYVTVSQGEKLSPEGEELAMTTVQLASAFLFTIGFHTKKSVRGNATDWYEILSQHLRCSKAARAWFCNSVLFANPARFSEYLLECPSAEVRQAFARTIVFCAHYSLSDGPSAVPACLQQLQIEIPSGAGLSDYLLLAVLSLLWSEVSEYGRHLSQYFGLFVMYCSLGVTEKTQLLRLNLPAIFIQVALDDGPGPPIKYQYADLVKLYQVVSSLVRCCDVSSVTQSSVEGRQPLSNPFAESPLVGGQPTYIMPIQPAVAEHLFQRTGYLKKLIEEANNSDDTKRLLQFCCWENPHFSHAVLYELLWQIAFAYTNELRPYLHLLLYMLMLEDSWQTHRILKALKGIPDDHSSRDGLFETIQRSKNHYQKRAYQCIKMLVSLFTQCGPARHLLMAHGDLKRKWSWSVEWLHEELERGGQRTPYTSTPAGSNETANGYFLERSQSARLTLEKACELLPEEEEEEEEEEVGVEEGVVGGAALVGGPVQSPEEADANQNRNAILSQQQGQQAVSPVQSISITELRSADSTPRRMKTEFWWAKDKANPGDGM